MCSGPPVKRWPNEDSPSTVSAPSFTSVQRTGREKRSPLSSQRIDFENPNPRTIASTFSANASPSGRPGRSKPRNPSRATSDSTSTPWRFANPAAAFSARCSGGPFTHSSGVCSATSTRSAAIRRGPIKTLPGGAPSSRSTRTGSWAAASRQAPAGSSSQPISSSSVAIALLLQVQLRDLPRQGPDTPDVCRPLGDRQRSPRVQQVQRVRALEHQVVGRQRQSPLHQPTALLFELGEPPRQCVHGRELEVVRRPLPLAFAVDVAPRHPRRPLELERALLALQEHAQALEPVGHLGRDELHVEPPELLEVRPLRDLHAVAPDLPPQPPCPEGRLLPVVLDEPDVVPTQVDANRLERREVAVEDILGRRLQDYLVLEVVLEAVRVLAIAAVERPDHRFDVGRPPRLRAEAAQERRGVHRARRELGVVRLHDHAALGRPVPLERADHLLEVHGAEPNGVSATTAAGRKPATRSACGGGSRRGTRRTP